MAIKKTKVKRKNHTPSGGACRNIVSYIIHIYCIDMQFFVCCYCCYCCCAVCLELANEIEQAQYECGVDREDAYSKRTRRGCARARAQVNREQQCQNGTMLREPSHDYRHSSWICQTVRVIIIIMGILPFFLLLLSFLMPFVPLLLLLFRPSFSSYSVGFAFDMYHVVTATRLMAEQEHSVLTDRNGRGNVFLHADCPKTNSL